MQRTIKKHVLKQAILGLLMLEAALIISVNFIR
ncbi:hypothetical protein tloyanaT_04160 [Thalassotalea loyana]|uniref:Uncharacterized protein n=1 Tax=Thalassotalea loyana TaxID=280483 RepID=A0ABQ6H859_9GAMM|nr:hypothetical protein tloyanaT_04160 [Thalassotalea loyana]